MKLLIVDDDVYTREGLAENIPWELYGIEEVMQAENGKEALHTVSWYLPVLIITDIRMPGMTGLELMQKVRQQHISCEFIVVSGYSDFSYAKEAIAYGVAGYCLKPLNPDETALCLKRVRESLDKRGAVPGLPTYIDNNFEKILNYMNTHFSEKITLKSLAAEFDMNPNYCCSLFAKYLDKTFSQHLTQLRINEAQSLLRNSSYSLEQVASLVGYSDYFYFSKVFKKQCTYSPKEYRKLFSATKESSQ